jgi:hypothetical protein
MLGIVLLFCEWLKIVVGLRNSCLSNDMSLSTEEKEDQTEKIPLIAGPKGISAKPNSE